MPPVQHDNTIVHLRDDGRYEHRFRQSWVNTFMDCPDKARLDAFGPPTFVNTDATLLGTTIHSVIEHAIQVRMETGTCLLPSALREHFNIEWGRNLDDNPDMRWVKRKPTSALLYGEQVVNAFALHVLPFLDPLAYEVPFGPTIIHQDDKRVITITGTIDYVDRQMGLVDWKSGSQEYKQWERQRWAVQPTFYTAGWHSLTAPGGKYEAVDVPDDWHYCVFVDRRPGSVPQPQWVRVDRSHYGWSDWMTYQLIGIAKLLEATHAGHLDEWPLRDHHALCSPKWCEHWDECKGLWVPEEVVLTNPKLHVPHTLGTAH